MLNSISSSVFTNSDSITMVPVVSAEWNNNLFNPPYITVAGNGDKITNTIFTGTVASVTSGAHEYFETKSFSMSNGAGSVSYKATGLLGGTYKIVTHVKTDNPQPIMINAYGKSSVDTTGSTQEEADNLGWTKIITYVRLNSTDSNLDLVYTISANAIVGTGINPTVYFTLPEFYATTEFDYRNNSLWSTENPFKNFRPGESYVGSGNTLCSFPSTYRRITKSPITGTFYSPISSVLQNPSSAYINPRVPISKTSLPSITSSFKYFVSDDQDTAITARYEKLIPTNKIVVKLNTIATTPVLNITINDQIISIGGSANITVPTTGLLTLYWSGTGWTTNKWSTMPKFNDNGSLSFYTTINKITIEQADRTINPPFDTYLAATDSAYLGDDLNRMQVIEISPRLEVDLSDFVENFSTSKTLDSGASSLPISGINSNSASIQLAGMPLVNNGVIVPIFSSQNNSISTPLSKMLKKGIKFYLGYNLQEYASQGSVTTNLSTYIPAGVFYSESWDESDIETVAIQCFDVTRYLQSLPAQDHVVKGKNAFDVLTDILELTGFTDYDFDSLYDVCNNATQPLDIYHYSVYSKDTTLIGSLNELLTPYQVAAYIDEYGIMKFISLHALISSSSSSLSISDSNIKQGGFAVSNKAKPGKISIKFAQPRTKQSLSVQSIKDVQTLESVSSIYIRSNDILWQQQKIDAVGFDYIAADKKENNVVVQAGGIDEKSTTLSLNTNSINDIFHAYNRDASGYVVIEDEILSYEDKEYELEAITVDGYDENGTPITSLKTKKVSIKNDLELQSAINEFIKKYDVGISVKSSTITNAVGNGVYVEYTSVHSLTDGDYVQITGISPQQYNIAGEVFDVDSSSFKISSSAIGTYTSGGSAISEAGYNLKETPTGRLLNVQRGMFGTSPNEHKRITDLASKGLAAKVYNIATKEVTNAPSSSTSITDNQDEYSMLPSLSKIRCFSTDSLEDIYIMPSNHLDPGYQTYSTKFNLTQSNFSGAGIAFNVTNGFKDKIMVLLYKDSQKDPKTGFFYEPPRYKYSVAALKFVDGSDSLIGFADVTAQCNSIIENFPKIAKRITSNNQIKFEYHADEVFNLQVVWDISHGESGEDGTENDPKNILHVYLNGLQVSGWQIVDEDYIDPEGEKLVGYKPVDRNSVTGLPKNLSMEVFDPSGSQFGFVTMSTGYLIPYLYTPQTSNNVYVSAYVREIHATEKPLLSRSVNYIYQDTEFLDGIIQNKPVGSLYKTYLMQTTPECRFINVYDVEYGIPAATTAQNSIIQYMLRYYADNNPQSQSDQQKLKVSEYAVSYSTILNTGHSAKFAIANNADHMVFIQKEADSATSVSTKFTIWTNEAVVPSDPELIEKIIDPTNAAEVVQLDTKWIQSKTAAQKLMKTIQSSIDGFSKDVSLKMFGNPLLQIGDVITLNYSLNGISGQKYVVTNINQEFSEGLETNIIVNRIPQ